MNPWAIILALIAVGCLVVSYKGTQDNLFSAVTGKQVGSTTLGTSSSSGATTTPPLTNGGGFHAPFPGVPGGVYVP